MRKNKNMKKDWQIGKDFLMADVINDIDKVADSVQESIGIDRCSALMCAIDLVGANYKLDLSALYRLVAIR